MGAQAFRTLSERVEYTAEAEGILVSGFGVHVEAVWQVRLHSGREPPDSHRLPMCELREANADDNAAKNIGMRYVRRGQQSSRRTGNSQLALKEL